MDQFTIAGQPYAAGAALMALALATPWAVDRRIAYFDASWDVLVDAFKSKPSTEITSTLPTDARPAYLVLNHERRMARVFFTSASLDVVPEGGVIPEFIVQLGMRTDGR